MLPPISRSLQLLAACLAVVLSYVWALRTSLILWLLVEFAFHLFQRKVLIPRLASFRPEDVGTCMSKEQFDIAMDHVSFLLKQDPAKFWQRVTGLKLYYVTEDVARRFLRSLLFLVGDTDAEAALLEQGLERISAITNGFAPSTGTVGLPNRISGWTDDVHLTNIVRTTPLMIGVMAELSIVAASICLRLFGWRPGATSKVSVVQYSMLAPNVERVVGRPLVLIPGAALGFVSFLPLALYLQKMLTDRTIILFRLPWVECGRPWVKIPQWSEIISDMVIVLKDLGIEEFDVVAHSYGTAVANRLLRKLCATSVSRANQAMGALHPMPDATVPVHECGSMRVGFMGLIDPIVLGGASTGLVGIINALGPDICMAFCANRAGISSHEVLSFNPQVYGQCRDGVSAYFAEGDVLVDTSLARELLQNVVPKASCVVDRTWCSFHSRWLVELWLVGPAWAAPCASQCLHLLLRGLK